MTTLKTATAGLFLFISSISFASLEDYNTTSDSIKMAYKPAKSHRFNLLIPSVVVHGFKPDQPLANEMPRKLDANGNSVYTPGIGIEYKGQDNFMFMGAFVKDCYDNPAGTIQVGNFYKLSKNTDWAWSLGLYARQTPYICIGNQEGKQCNITDSFSFKFMTKVNGYDVDIIPLPFLHFTSSLYKDSNLEIKFKFMGNFLLNEIGLEIPI